MGPNGRLELEMFCCRSVFSEMKNNPILNEMFRLRLWEEYFGEGSDW